MLGLAYVLPMTTITSHSVDELFDAIVRDGISAHESDVTFVAQMAAQIGAPEGLVDAALDTDLNDVVRTRALAQLAVGTLATI